MLFQWDFTTNFFQPLGGLAGLFLLLLGIMWLIYSIYESKRRGSFKKRNYEEWDSAVATKFLKVLTYVGFVVGIFSLMSGISGLMYNIPPSGYYAEVTGPSVSIFTSSLLIVLGILTFLKPLNDLPIASVLGLLVASAIVLVLVIALPAKAYEFIGIFMDPKLFFIILFIVVFAIIALTTKFYIGILMKISKFISWPPIAFIVAAFCLLQGFLIVVLGVSITGIF